MQLSVDPCAAEAGEPAGASAKRRPVSVHEAQSVEVEVPVHHVGSGQLTPVRHRKFSIPYLYKPINRSRKLTINNFRRLIDQLERILWIALFKGLRLCSTI